MPEPRYLLVGQIVRPHGVRGEVRVKILTDYPERLPIHRYFYVGAVDADERLQRYPVEGMRFHQDVVLLKLAGCDDRNTAETLRGLFVQIPIEAAAPLEEGEYYLFQLIGVQVEADDGRGLGTVVDVIETKANDVLVVQGPLGEILLPDVDEVVLSLDVASGRMVVRPLPGMLPDEDGGIE